MRGMNTRLVTTTFVARPEDVPAAFASYRERLAGGGVDVVTHSLKPRPCTDADCAFELWNLRTEAAYEGAQEPEKMNLHQVSAIVRVDPAQLEDESFADHFFLSDLEEQSPYPSTLGAFVPLELRHEPHGKEMRVADVYYLSRSGNEGFVEELYAASLDRLNPIAHTELQPFDALSNPAAVGPLWVRDAALNASGDGDGWFSPGKEAWTGHIFTDAPEEEIHAALQESIGDRAVLARVEIHPF